MTTTPPSPTSYGRAAALLLHAAADPGPDADGIDVVLDDVTTVADYRDLLDALLDVVQDMAHALLTSPPGQAHLRHVTAHMAGVAARTEGGRR